MVTAFTAGHSATLAVGALGGALLPSSFVEAAIAASVLVAFRLVGAGVTAALAPGWLLERTASFANPLARPLAWMESHPFALLLELASLALAARHGAGPARAWPSAESEVR